MPPKKNIIESLKEREIGNRVPIMQHYPQLYRMHPHAFRDYIPFESFEELRVTDSPRPTRRKSPLPTRKIPFV